MTYSHYNNYNDDCGPIEKKTYLALKYCPYHCTYDLCDYKSQYYKCNKDNCKGKCPDKCCKKPKCDDSKDCCDKKIKFDCKDLDKTEITKSIEEMHDMTTMESYSVTVKPIVKECKVVGFDWEVDASVPGYDVIAKLLTVKTCKDAWTLTECELGDGMMDRFELYGKCGCTKLHEIQTIEFCLIRVPKTMP